LSTYSKLIEICDLALDTKKPGEPQAFMNWPHECPRRYQTGGA